MQTQMVFINLFLVPLTGLYFFVKRKNGDFSPSLKLLCFYAFFVCWNIPVTHGLMVLTRKFGILFGVESGYYTAFALVSSIIVYGVAVILSEFFNITFKVERKNKK